MNFFDESYSEESSVTSEALIRVSSDSMSGLVVETNGEDPAMLFMLERIASTLVEKNMSPFALLFSAYQAKNETQLVSEKLWAAQHPVKASIVCLYEKNHKDRAAFLCSDASGNPDSWCHLITVLVYALVQEGISLEEIVQRLQTGANRRNHQETAMKEV